MLKPAEHFCKVAAINHEVVDEKQRQMIESANVAKTYFATFWNI